MGLVCDVPLMQLPNPCFVVFAPLADARGDHVGATLGDGRHVNV